MLFLSGFLFFLYLNKNFNKKSTKTPYKDFVEKTSFIEREAVVRDILTKKYQESDSLEVYIGREDLGHLNGLFYAKNKDNENVVQGKFFAVMGSELEIVWFGEGQADCDLLIYHKFPKEMAPLCF